MSVDQSVPDSGGAWDYVHRAGATYVRHGSGVRISWQSKHGNGGRKPCGKCARCKAGKGCENWRGDIRDQSRASRQRAAYAFGNCSARWLAMVTLTWPGDCEPGNGSEVKAALVALRVVWMERWGEGQDGWIMEMHKSGVPHFHLFVAEGSEFGKMVGAMPTRTVIRKGRETRLVGGMVERWLVGTWLGIIGQLENESAQRFNRGGIIELFRTPDAAGRYVAKESSKREQKVLPERYAGGLGRWWYLSPRWPLVGVESGTIDDAAWKHDGPLKHVWEASRIRAALVPDRPPLPRPDSTGRRYVLARRPPLALSGLAVAAGVGVVVQPAAPYLTGLAKNPPRHYIG